MKQGRRCQCPCGCPIWIGATGRTNDSICRFCAGPRVFGKQLEPQHVGTPEGERKLSGAYPKVDRRPKCARCKTPIRVDHGKVVHVPGYYTNGHEATVVS